MFAPDRAGNCDSLFIDEFSERVIIFLSQAEGSVLLLTPPRLDESRYPVPPASLMNRLVFHFLECLRFRELLGLESLYIVIPAVASVDTLPLPVFALVGDPNVIGFRSSVDACHVLAYITHQPATASLFLSHFALTPL